MKKIARLAFCALLFMPIFSFSMDEQPEPEANTSSPSFFSMMGVAIADTIFGVDKNIIYEIENDLFDHSPTSCARLEAAFKSQEQNVEATKALIEVCAKKGIECQSFESVKKAKELLQAERTEKENAYKSSVQASYAGLEQRRAEIQKSVQEMLSSAWLKLENLKEEAEKINLKEKEHLASIIELTNAKTSANALHSEAIDLYTSLRAHHYDLDYLQQKTGTKELIDTFNLEVLRDKKSIEEALQTLKENFEQPIRQ